jgi:hypothetical protein
VRNFFKPTNSLTTTNFFNHTPLFCAYPESVRVSLSFKEEEAMHSTVQSTIEPTVRLCPSMVVGVDVKRELRSWRRSILTKTGAAQGPSKTFYG